MISGHSGTTLNDAIREWLAMADPSWPTPMARDRKGAGRNGHASPTLEAAVRAADESQLFPTPRASDARRGTLDRYRKERGAGGPNLPSALREWTDAPFHRDPSIDPAGTPGSPTVYLNPSFVEALMGFPIGWTDLPRSETLSLKL
jgi:hypothetical protein